jgi:Arc/MetJ-type ribon-helix-helix transcriptional regulator
VKLSVSLPGQDVEFLDAYAKSRGLESRSAAVQEAVQLLRSGELEAAYASAWAEWTQAGDGPLWESTAADGLGD